MGNIPYLRKRRYGWYWEPGKHVRALGFAILPLGKDEEAARQKAVEANKQVEAERQKIAAAAVGSEPGSVGELIDAYLDSEEFSEIRPKTQESYRYCLKALGSWAGDFQVDDVDAKALKAFYRSMRAETPTKANRVLAVTRLLWRWGLTEGYTTEEPARQVRIKGTEPRQALWSPDEVSSLIAAAEKVGRPSVALAIRLAFDCTQRQGDVLSLTWNQIQDGWISFTQSKTGTQCDIPLTPDLEAMLTKTEKVGVQVVINEDTKQPYNEHRFRKVFAQVRKAAGLEGQFMDLRRSGMVEAAHAGVELRDIAARSGHQIDRALAILNTYLPATKAMAATAVRKVSEAREQRRNR